MSSISKIPYWLAFAVGFYALILGILLTPDVQRLALYAHKVNTLWLHDTEKPELFGFYQRQVTPFAIQTRDSQKLYAWHVLPIDLFVKHESRLLLEQRRAWQNENMRDRLGLQLINSNNASKIVISFHGNAGHIAQGWRPETYRMIASQPNTHLFTIDYRGFGHSDGTPSEAGLISDGVSLVNWVMKNTNVTPDRIVILGQSLGTAVSAAVALYFADPAHPLLLSDASEISSSPQSVEHYEPVIFARVVLVASFFNLPNMLLTYRMGGLLPILLPLRPFPALANYLTSKIVDKWRTGDRLAAYYSSLLRGSNVENDTRHGTLHLIHAKNDADISYRQTEMIYQHISELWELDTERGNVPQLAPDHKHLDRAPCGSNKMKLHCEIVDYGGHNSITTHSPVLAAIVKAYN